MPSPDEITSHLEKIVEQCNVVLSWASGDKVSVRMIKDDVTHLNTKKQVLLRELEEMEKRKETMFDEAKLAITRARSEADQILSIARENLAYAAKDREAAEIERKKAEQSAYLSEKKLNDLVAA